MLQTVWAQVLEGQIHLSEPIQLPEGTRVLVTVMPENDQEFWLGASQDSLAAIWNNPEDGAYAQLLEE